MIFLPYLWINFANKHDKKKYGQKFMLGNLTRCFMATALNSYTLMSLITTGGITKFTLGLLFYDNSGSLHCNV